MVPNNAAITLNIDGIPGVSLGGTVGTPASFNLITDTAGGLAPAVTAIGELYNTTNYTVGSLNAASATAISVNLTPQTALTGETWVGGLAGGNNVWALSNGSTASNWDNTSGLTATSLTPGPTATVTFSTPGSFETRPSSRSMSVLGVATTDSNPVAVNYDGYTLSVGTGGLAVGSASGGLGIADFVALNGNQTWTNNSTTNTLTVSNRISNSIASTLTTAGLGTTVLSGNNTYAGTTTASNGTLVLSGSNIGIGNTTNTPGQLIITQATANTTTVVSLNNSNALGAGSLNSGLAAINMDDIGGNANTPYQTVILQIGAKIGTDPGGNNADFSYRPWPISMVALTPPPCRH